MFLKSLFAGQKLKMSEMLLQAVTSENIKG